MKIDELMFKILHIETEDGKQSVVLIPFKIVDSTSKALDSHGNIVSTGNSVVSYLIVNDTIDNGQPIVNELESEYFKNNADKINIIEWGADKIIDDLVRQALVVTEQHGRQLADEIEIVSNVTNVIGNAMDPSGVIRYGELKVDDDDNNTINLVDPEGDINFVKIAFNCVDKDVEIEESDALKIADNIQNALENHCKNETLLVENIDDILKSVEFTIIESLPGKITAENIDLDKEYFIEIIKSINNDLEGNEDNVE